MAREVTELVTMTFNPGTDQADTVSRLYAIISRQEGFVWMKWGIWEENPSKVQLVITWTDMSTHEKFAASGAEYAALFEVIAGILTANPFLIHVYFESGSDSLATLLEESPIVELATFFGIKDGFDEAVEQTLSLGKTIDGCLGYTRGPVVEEIAPAGSEEKGKAHFAVTGWTSLGAHLEARGREDVVESGGKVVGLLGGYEVCHVKFQ
ncbi:hypothetical protein BJX99DRAFT_256541 [Aspergillus californicus]